MGTLRALAEAILSWAAMKIKQKLRDTWSGWELRMKWGTRDWLHMRLITYACVLYVSVFICVIMYLCMHMPDYACVFPSVSVHVLPMGEHSCAFVCVHLHLRLFG